MKYMKSIKLIGKRLKSETPDFFKKLRNWALIIGALTGALSSLPVTWPAWVVAVFTLIIAICSSVAGTSQLTTSDNKLSNT